MRPLRVVYIITGLQAGGAEQMLYKLLSRCDRKRLASTVISLQECGGLWLPERIRELGIAVHSLSLRPHRPRPASCFELSRLLRGIHPDLLCGWEVHGNLGAYAASFLARRTPLIWNVRGSLDDVSSEKAATRLLIRGLARVSGRPRRIVYNARSAARQHEEAGYRADRTAVIPNGFDCDLFHPDEAARAAVRRELGLPADALLVGMLARHHQVKDHGTFLRAAELVARRGLPVHFVLAGKEVTAANSVLRRTIEASSLGPRVSLLGERRDTARLTAALDVACLSSVAEGFPNALGEAMACGVPCVSTAVGDAGWLIGDCGRTVPVRQPAAFAEALAGLLALPRSGRRVLGEAARRRILSCFGIDQVASQFAALYRELCPRSGETEVA